MFSDRPFAASFHRSPAGWRARLRPAICGIGCLLLLLAAPALSSAPSHQAPASLASGGPQGATPASSGSQGPQGATPASSGSEAPQGSTGADQAVSLWRTDLAEGRTDVVFFPDDPLTTDADRRPIPMPVEWEVSLIVEAMAKNISRPPSWDGPQGRYAMNVNTLDEVADSSWFTNRHGLVRQSPASLEEGPDESGPPRGDVWQIVGTVGEGRTEKFMMEDATGRTFIVKLESVDHPELMSSAEVICTKFFHSLGYNVPENHIVTFAPEQLVVEDEDVYPAVDLAARLEETPRTPDGQVRAVASLMLEGEPLGPFKYTGTRPDDPNDIFPHEHRRELRALRVFSAWLNHTDVKSGNSLDTYIGDVGEGHIRHHLIDFGSCLGSAASGAKDRVTGWEYYLEPDRVGRGIIGLGLWERPYVLIDYPDHPAVGTIEADLYEPWLWKPPIPNPAFLMMDAADAFWGARIVARYTDEDIRTLVEEGRITDPAEEDHLVDVLIGRRDKTAAYWLTRTNPLDKFEVATGAAGRELRFENLAVSQDLASVPVSYRHRWYRLDNHAGARTAVTEEMSAEAHEPEAAIPLPADPWGPADEFGLRYALVEIRTVHLGFPHWDRPVLVALRNADGNVDVVGIRRPRELPPPPPS